MVQNIALSASVRSNLGALQQTTRDISTTQTILSSGLKVNGPTDDANAFFKARSLNNRAADFLEVKGNIGNAINTVNAASKAIDAVTSLVEQMKGVIGSARQTSDTDELTSLETQYNDLRTQINGIVGDASFGGINLIKGTPDDLTVNFNPDASSSLTISGVSLNATGLSLTAGSDFETSSTLDSREDEVNAALNTLRTQAANFGTNASILKIRDEFTQGYANELKNGAGSLTLADLNEEGANLLALQTRQQLGINSLSLSIQSERSVLSLF